MILLCAAGGHAQDSFRTQLFREADYSRIRAKEQNADILAPKSFSAGMDAYNEAKDAFQHGRPLDEIQEHIRAATRSFNASIEAVRNAEKTFASVLEARTDAMTADAPGFCPELFNKAEALFHAATGELEDGSTAAANTDGGEAQGLFRKAELEAIKANSLTRTRELLQRADAMKVQATAPQTLERARKLLRLADGMIQQNRYDNTEARQFADEASYEAAHAIYLHQMITQLQSQGHGYEDALLQFEASIRRIATTMGLPGRFDAGPEATITQIIAALQAQDSTIAALTARTRSVRSPAETQRKRVIVPPAADSSRNGAQKNEQAIAIASGMLKAEDGTIIRDGNNVLLRIYGLDFATGKSALEPRFGGLLSTIQRIIRLFPNCQIMIEGHTDKGGNESVNQNVSEARAAAVAAYLRNALPPSTPIVSQGNGSIYPISAGTTPEGRARNRRIDIIIIPEWAIVGR
jgi:OOP family OmpA-OmpF porin